MSIPTDQEILKLLDDLEYKTADQLETKWLEFKPWSDPKDDMKVAIEYAVCFANADGGAVVFGVKDGVRGRANAIHGAERYNLETWRTGVYSAVDPHLDIGVSELAVPEGTGRLLVVRIPPGEGILHGTTSGIFKRRVGKSCMPISAQEFLKARISSGALDWSGEPAEGVSRNDIDPVEVARARQVLRSKNPDSDLLRLDDGAIL